MNSSTKATFVFVFGDKVISGTGYVKSYSMECDRSYMQMESINSYMPVNIIPDPFFDLDISIRAKSFNISEGERVSRKLVQDCSIEELIFAIQKKIKK